MAQITHNVSTPNDGLGDELRTAMGHQNTMNSELYNTKVDKVTGMGLSQNSFSNAEKSKLAGITDGAEVNVQADFLQNDNTADDYIKNKPSQLFASVGYFHYADLATQTVPLTFVANVNKKLTNDKLGVYTNESQAPYGVSTIWNGTTNQFDFSNLSIGDTLQTRVDLTFNTASANQSYTIFLRMGIGSPSQYDLQITSFNVKNVTSNLHIVRDISFSIDNSDWRDYPSEVYVVTDSTGTVKVNGWYVPIIRKSVNIIDFPDSFKYKGELDLTTPLLVNGIGTIGDVYKVVQTGNYDFGAGLVKYYGGDFIFYDGLSYELFVYNNQLNLGNFPDATLPLVGTEQVLLNDGAWKKVTANNLLSGKLDKVSTVDVEKVYVKNADGTQSMKPTSEFQTPVGDYITVNTTQTVTGNKTFNDVGLIKKLPTDVYPNQSGGNFTIGGSGGYDFFDFYSFDGTDQDSFGIVKIYSNPEVGNFINHISLDNENASYLNVNYFDLSLINLYAGQRTALYVDGQNGKIKIEGTQNRIAALGTSLITGTKNFEFPNQSGTLALLSDLSGFTTPSEVATQITTAINSNKTSFTHNILASDWTFVSGKYEAIISNAGILANSFVDVIPSNDHVDIVRNAQIYPSVLISEGSVKVYSKFLPSGTITVTININ